MLITILIIALFISFGINGSLLDDAEGKKNSIMEAQGFMSEESKTIILQEFKKVPKLIEKPASKPVLSWSHSAVAIDADSGKILFGKEERSPRPIASLTKMMTAIIVEENIKDWSQEVLISKKAALAGGSGVHFKWDEKITADNLFKAMLMNSDNSAAIALAEHITGNTEEFAKIMNEKAKELGAFNTVFKEPTGLEDEESYSSAFDLAKITQYAISKNKIIETMQMQGPIWIKSCDGRLEHRIGNTNLFLKNGEIAPRVIGGKTGFTYKAGYCLMVAMEGDEEKEKVVGVILNSGENMRWEEMKQMFDWVFDNYKWKR